MQKNILNFKIVLIAFVILSSKGESSPLFFSDSKISSFIHFIIDNGKGFRILHTYEAKSNRVNIVVYVDSRFVKIKKLKTLAKEIQSELSYQTHLPILEQGIENILRYLKTKPIGFQSVIWNRKGNIKDSRGRKYTNKLIVTIENKNSVKVEKKIRLFLIDKYNREEHKRQFTLSANAHDYGTFNLSNYFQFLPKLGVKKLVFSTLEMDKSIEVKSSNKEIFVVNLIKG